MRWLRRLSGIYKKGNQETELDAAWRGVGGGGRRERDALGDVEPSPSLYIWGTL